MSAVILILHILCTHCVICVLKSITSQSSPSQSTTYVFMNFYLFFLYVKKSHTILVKIFQNTPCKKLNLSRYRPGQAQSVSGSYRSHITWQRHRMLAGCQPYTPATFCPQEIFLILISVRGCVDPRAMVRSEGFCQWKIPVTPSGIEPATSRFVAQCLNHCATAVPKIHSIQKCVCM